MKKHPRTTARAVALATVGLFSAAPAFAAVSLVADQAYDTGGAVFTLDPELTEAPNARGVTGTRMLRQTFVLGTAVNVDEIVMSLRLNGNDDGLNVSIFEVANPTASSWSAGTLVKSFTFDPTTFDLPTTTATTGILLTGSDIFTMAAGSYGIEISNGNGGDIGVVRHDNDSADTDNYTSGRFYIESGSPSTSAHRDLGVSISGSPVPEPSVALLGGLGLLGMMRRRRA